MINKDTYKRLTKINEFGCPDLIGVTSIDVVKAIDRLYELEDKIEEGTLVELPCKVGDTLYFPQYYCDSRGCSMHEQSYCCGCKEMITRERNNEKYIIATKNCGWSDIPTIGKKYFVTRAEVEARLKELQENKK